MVDGIEDVSRPTDRGWSDEAVRLLEADAARSADTHLLAVPLPPGLGVDLYVKDERSHPTGSLKHRLARSLLLHGVVNGWITRGTTLVEASSGSTAVSEAYFARLLGLPFVAVLPRSTSADKVDLITAGGGRCELVDDPTEVYARAEQVAAETGGHYLDQFTYAERATDWRGNNTIASSTFEQLRSERHPVPAWIVVGAGTGGTSATLGRYVRYHRYATRICVVDPERSAFLDGWRDGDPSAIAAGSRIEGIGRPRMEPSFLPGVVDRMLRVPDAASIAAMRWLQATAGWCAGPSSGTNLVGALHLLAGMRDAGERGSIVTLLCDDGTRYRHTWLRDDHAAAQGLDLAPWSAWIADCLGARGPQLDEV